MFGKTKIPYALRNATLTAALAAIGGHAGATLMADGKLGDNAPGSPSGTDAAALAEGYSFGFNTTLLNDKGDNLGVGSIYFGTAADGSQFLYVLLPTSYVDNSYAPSGNPPGWTSGHTFSDLTGSDGEGQGAAFGWTNTKGATTKGSIDYIAQCTADPTGCTGSPAPFTSGYKSGGLGSSGTGITSGANGAAASWSKVDTKIALTGSAASLLQVATSLEYDLNNIDPTATSTSSSNPNWVKEVGYEYQFAAGTFDTSFWNGTTMVASVNASTGTVQFGTASAAGLLQIGDFHVSPPKGDKATSYTPPCLIGSPGCAAPEPGSLALIASGLAAAGWFRRRQKTDPDAGTPARIVAS